MSLFLIMNKILNYASLVFAILRLITMLFCLLDNSLNDFLTILIKILNVIESFLFMYSRVYRD